MSPYTTYSANRKSTSPHVRCERQHARGILDSSDHTARNDNPPITALAATGTDATTSATTTASTKIRDAPRVQFPCAPSNVSALPAKIRDLLRSDSDRLSFRAR